MLLSKKTFQIAGRLWHLDSPMVWGIINLTPDSFYDGGRLRSDKALCSLAERHLSEGAVVLDIGGQSTRPGATYLSPQTEWERVKSPIAVLRKRFPTALLSIDTFHVEVAKWAIEAGVHILNDVSGGGTEAAGDAPHKSAMFQLVAKKKVPYVLMHARANPQPQHTNTQYREVIGEIWTYFQHRIQALRQLCHADIFIDPGFGFAKTPAQSLYLLKHMALFQALEHPLLVGISRKSLIYKTLNTTPEHALSGTHALHMVALQNGANILRTHDTQDALNTIRLFNEMQNMK